MCQTVGAWTRMSHATSTPCGAGQRAPPVFLQQAPSLRTVLPGDAIQQFGFLRLGQHRRIGRPDALNGREMIWLGAGRYGPQQHEDAYVIRFSWVGLESMDEIASNEGLFTLIAPPSATASILTGPV